MVSPCSTFHTAVNNALAGALILYINKNESTPMFRSLIASHAALRHAVRPWLVAAALGLTLAACQTTIRQANDCKAGDWSVIGGKDGGDGLTPRFDERRTFCAGVDGGKIGPEAPAMYQQGWNTGNASFWSKLGYADGYQGMPVGQFATRATSGKVAENKTPLNRPAYEQGWTNGNAGYWRYIGNEDGKAGQPASYEARQAAAGRPFGFNLESWKQGWRDGNYAYWERIGFQDAHDGVPDSELKHRAQQAQAKGLQVRDDAYLAAWNKEIIEYWRRLGAQDATDGRDVHMRRADARQRGLVFAEAEYQQQWEQRLVSYWRDAGRADGFGYPHSLDQRIANARRDNVFVIAQTRDLYNQAWDLRNAEYCRVDNAFEMGRDDKRMATEVCRGRDEHRARRAWMSGRDYADLARKLRYVKNDVAAAYDRRSDLNRKLERLDAEIKRDKEDKNRAANADNDKADARRDKERKELREALHHVGEKLADLRAVEFRHEQQMAQIKRDIYRD